MPFLACLILTGIHAYLGLHVIERQVIFVDLALAQIAALGAGLALVFGLGMDSGLSYAVSLGFTILGALFFSLTRRKKQRIPQEAVIGIAYAVSAAFLFLVLSRFGEGDEHIRQAFTGNILLVTPSELIKIVWIYSAVGIMHYIFRRQFLLISQNPEEAYRQGLRVRFWDFLFYASFGVVVTSSVKIAGVLLVFSFLIVPSAAALLFSTAIKTRLWIGWLVGVIASALGMTASYFFDWPTGASVVCVFGALLILLGLFQKFKDG